MLTPIKPQENTWPDPPPLRNVHVQRLPPTPHSGQKWACGHTGHSTPKPAPPLTPSWGQEDPPSSAVEWHGWTHGHWSQTSLQWLPQPQLTGCVTTVSDLTCLYSHVLLFFFFPPCSFIRDDTECSIRTLKQGSLGMSRPAGFSPSLIICPTLTVATTLYPPKLQGHKCFPTTTCTEITG